MKQRICGYADCDNSLEYMTRRAQYCSSKHGIQERTRQRTLLRAKKRRYNERHNIKRTTIKRNLPYNSGLDTVGFEIIYENYKEPLKQVEKSVGFGYYGTIATTTDHQYIQCHYCGKLFEHLGLHVQSHGTTARDYKERFGLGITTALVSDTVRETMVTSKIATSTKELPPWLEEYNRRVQGGEIKHGNTGGNGGMTLKRRNELGLCSDQVLVPIQKLAKKLGRAPSEDEFRREYGQKYTGSIRYQHGSFVAAVNKAGYTSAKELKEPDNDHLLQLLIDFKEKYNRIPMTSDFNRGLVGRSRGLYNSRFGNLNEARLAAGMNAIVPLFFGKVKEMTAEEYVKYKGGDRTYNAVKAKKRRNRIKQLKLERV